MTFELLDLIASQWYQLFGGGYMLAIVIVAAIVMMLLIAKAPRAAIFIVLVPLITAMAAYPLSYISIERWIGVLIWVGMGFIMAVALWAIFE